MLRAGREARPFCLGSRLAGRRLAPHDDANNQTFGEGGMNLVAKFVGMVAAALTLVATGGAANAQQKSLKERLAGTWHFVIAEVTAPDGTKSFPFGPKPRGMVIFTPQGDFMQIHIAAEVPKIANGNRLQATPEEYAGIMRGTIAQFGTYTVDEDKKQFTMKFTASTFPNWEGVSQTRTIDKLTDEEFINTNPQVGAGRGSAYNLYRRTR
jgi:Lipocalin-like domain